MGVSVCVSAYVRFFKAFVCFRDEDASTTHYPQKMRVAEEPSRNHI